MSMFGISSKISFGRKDKIRTQIPPPSISSPIHSVQPPNRSGQAQFNNDNPAALLNRRSSFDVKVQDNRSTKEFEPPPSYNSTISTSPRLAHYGLKNHRPLSQLSVSTQLIDDFNLQSTSLSSMNQNDSTTSSFQDVRSIHGLPSSSPKLHFPSKNSSKATVNLSELDMPKLVATVKPYSEVASRTVVLVKSETGDFGFSMNREETENIHILEPRNSISTLNGLLSGDRLVEVNSMNVESLTHDEVVNLIRQSNDIVTLKVIAPPELLELALRGALIAPKQISKALPRRRKKSVHHRTAHANFIGTMRKSTVLSNRQSSVEPSDTPGMQWLTHKDGYCGVLLTEDLNSVNSTGSTTSLHGYGRLTGLSRSYSTFNDSIRVNIIESNHVLQVEQNDIEVAQTNVEGIENLAELNYLSEANCLHVLRTRYASSLIHTYAGRHLIVINPVRELKSYSERVIEMFRGCQKDDMPPHIFSVSQTAYNEMRSSRRDQTIILQGMSGSGKTYNARFIICYLSTIAAFPEGIVTSDKLVAAGLLLISFGSASTHLNQQATRFTNFTTLNFDSLGRIISAVITPYLLERTRVTDTLDQEYTYNIIYQLILGANEALVTELMLSYEYSQEHPFVNFLDTDFKDQAYHWSLIHDALPILEISEEESRGIFSLIAAAYHLGHAGATSTSKGMGKFVLSTAAQNAATILGTSVDNLQQEIFHHVNNRPSNGGVLSPNKLPSSPSRTSLSSSDKPHIALKWFIIGLYEHAFHALVLLINRALKGSSTSNKATSFSINVIDMPGFQNYSETSVTNSFDDLCHNYTQERLQMLFFDYSFTFELDKYHDEEVNFTFQENPISPLMVIDAIDKDSHQPKYTTDKLCLDSESKGLFWILDEESLFPNSDSSLMEKLKGNFIGGDSARHKRGPALKVIDNSQFVVAHFQGLYPVTYRVTGWLERIRENNLIRAVPNILNSSKRQCIACVFQNKGVAAANLNMSGQDGPLAKRYTTRRKSQVMAGIPSSSKRNSVCLLTKFYLDYLIDEIRKTNQFFIRCIVPHPPELNEVQVNLLDFNVPFVRKQFKCGELLKATRIYKQGYPETMHYPVFLRRFGVLNLSDNKDESPPTLNSKERSRNLLRDTLQLDESKYKLGQSKIFFRVGTLHQLNSKIEEKTMNTFVEFQAHCRGFLARIHYEDLKLHDIAITTIQRNVRLYTELRQFSWWMLVQETKPLIQQSELSKFEEENKKIIEKLEIITNKFNEQTIELENKRQNEDVLEERVVELTRKLNNECTVTTDIQSILSTEKMANRELHEKVLALQEELEKLKRENNSLREENTKLNLKQANSNLSTITSDSTNNGMDSQTVSRLKIEYEESELRRRKAESECKSLEDDRADLQESLNKLRSRLSKVTTELTDARIYGEDQSSKFLELDKKQKKHEIELSQAKESADVEKQSREKLSREKATLEVEIERLKEELKIAEETKEKIKSNLDDMLFKNSSISEDHHEISELKRQKNLLEIKVENLEEENNDLQHQVNRLEKESSRLELENQNINRVNSKENDNLQEELDNTRSNYIKKVRNLEKQLEEELEDKNNIMSHKRNIEDELQRFMVDLSGASANLQKMKKKVTHHKALLDDSQTELKAEREKIQRNKLASKDLYNQLEELQNEKQALIRNLRNSKQELEELQESSEQHQIRNRELESQMADLARTKDDLETQLEDLEDDSKTLQEKISLLSQQLKDAQSKYSQQQDTLVNLTDEKTRLESKIENLEHQLLVKPEIPNLLPVSSNAETKLRDAESKLDVETALRKKVDKTNAKLTSQVQKLQMELEKAKENDNTKKLQNEVRKLKTLLEEAELKEEEAHKKKRDAERQLEDKETQLASVQEELRNLNIRSEKLRKAIETGNDSQDEFGHEDETSTSFEESPHIPQRYNHPNKRATYYATHNYGEDFDIPPISHRYQRSDPIDSDDNLSIRSTHSRSSYLTHEFEGNDYASKAKTYSPNNLEYPKTALRKNSQQSDNISEDGGKLSTPTIDSEIDDPIKTSCSSRPSSARSHERQVSIPEDITEVTSDSPNLPRPPLEEKLRSDDSSNTSSPSDSIFKQTQPPPLPAKTKAKSNEKRKERQRRAYQQEQNNI